MRVIIRLMWLQSLVRHKSRLEREKEAALNALPATFTKTAKHTNTAVWDSQVKQGGPNEVVSSFNCPKACCAHT